MQPGEMERRPRRGAAAAVQDRASCTPRRDALPRRSRLHAQAARRAGRCRPRLGISDFDRDTHERNALRDMGRDRRRCVENSGEQNEDAQGASRAALALRRRNSERTARPASRIIFPGWHPGRPIDDNTIARALQLLAGPVTAHGFRSSLRTWSAERTNFASEIAKAALAHAIKGSIRERTCEQIFSTSVAS